MAELPSFRRPVRAVVVGASGAIGSALVDELAACPQVESILGCFRSPQPKARLTVQPRRVDMLDEASIAVAVDGIECIDLAIVATGMLQRSGGLQPEKSWRSLDKAPLMESFAINAVGPALLAKHEMPLLPRGSKAALKQLIGTLAIDVGLHPASTAGCSGSCIRSPSTALAVGDARRRAPENHGGTRRDVSSTQRGTLS